MNTLRRFSFRPALCLLLLASTLCHAQVNKTPPAAPLIAPFIIVSGDLPPFAFANQAQSPGVAVEIAEALAQKLHYPVKVQFFPWARALAMAQSQKRVMILALTRIPEREDQYHWLVPIASQAYLFITHNKRHAPVQTMADAKTVTIGVLRGSPTLQHLLKNQFSEKRILPHASVENGLKALDSGIIDSYYGGELIAKNTMQSSGRHLQDYHFGLTLERGDLWLGGSKDFDQHDLDAIARAYDELKSEGTYARLLKKYLLLE